jgi:Cu2+-exporting ATPase
LWLSSRDLSEGLRQTDLSVPDVHCGACITTLESALKTLPEVASARVNLTTRRVSVVWRDRIDSGRTDPSRIVRTISDHGYKAHLFVMGPQGDDLQKNLLIRAVAVSGFASVNIMLLSVSVWSGAEAATRDLFHWISAMIAAPALIYAGRFFFQSAWNALRHGRTNMDVPISLAVTLSYCMSLYETIHHGEHAWFDASVTLLFFLLIGRTFDHIMRDRARSAITGLARLSPRGAMVIGSDGGRDYRPVDDIKPGDLLALAPGERVPVDSIVVSGRSDLDMSIVNGESAPLSASAGTGLAAGVMNLTGSLTLKATAMARDSFLSEVISLMEAAEGGRARYRRIADRAARLYSPAVHLLALMSLIFWVSYDGNWNHALLIAISVLIITCPCALGLAVPVVQVVAAGKLFRAGIMVKDGSAMERLAEADTVYFDKTGTLTMGKPHLVNRTDIAAPLLGIAANLALHSRHPLSVALQPYASSQAPGFIETREVPGCGVEADSDTGLYRLGNRDFALGKTTEAAPDIRPETVLSLNGDELATFRFEDRLRPSSAQTVRQLQQSGLSLGILSGDRAAVANALGKRLGIDLVKSSLSPSDKAAICISAAEAGKKVFMVGDGINDAPALTSAHVSMAPSTASDIGRQAADFVFLHDSLSAVPLAYDISRQAGQLIRQNFALAIGYNIIAVPVAILGYATPLVAAIAMSTSSIIVVVNALRLNAKKDRLAESGDRSLPQGAVVTG